MTLVDLFGGAGGAGLGLRRAGLVELAAYERDPDAAATYRRALEQEGRDPSIVRCVDLADVDAVPAADVWWASPPCQPFSQAGRRRDGDDPRDGFPHLLRLLRASPLPSWLLIEQVPRWASTDHSANVLAELRRLFPCVVLRKLCAADYGVPQTRKRAIVACGPQPFGWPAPTHSDDPRDGLPPWRTVRDALGDVRVIGGGRNPGWSGDVRRYRDLTDTPATTITAERIGNGGPFVVIGTGRTEGRERPRTPDEPCATTADRGATTLYQGERKRSLTPAECAALQGFPGDYPWSPVVRGLFGPVEVRGTQRTLHRQIGNAVPPQLAQALGRALAADGGGLLGIVEREEVSDQR